MDPERLYCPFYYWDYEERRQKRKNDWLKISKQEPTNDLEKRMLKWEKLYEDKEGMQKLKKVLEEGRLITINDGLEELMQELTNDGLEELMQEPTKKCLQNASNLQEQRPVFPGRERDSFQGISFLTQDLRSLSGLQQSTVDLENESYPDDPSYRDSRWNLDLLQGTSPGTQPKLSSIHDMLIYFDNLSRKILPSDMSIFCTHLLGHRREADTPLCRTNPSEAFFRILYTWWCRNPDIDYKNTLSVILKEMELAHLIDEMEEFSRHQFIYPASKIMEPGKFIDYTDITKVAGNVAFKYYNVVRFLGLEQNTINQIEADHATIKEQILVSLSTLMQKNNGLTRQSLCNALFYADHCDVIAVLNAKWEA